MRVLHATECAATGTLTVMIALVHELANAGVRQTVLYSRHAGTPDDLAGLFPPGVELVEVSRGRGSHLRFLMEFSSALRRLAAVQKPHVVHLHSSKAGFAGRLLLAAIRFDAIVLYSPHGLSFLDPDRPLRNAVFRALEQAASKLPARSVACSQGEADVLLSLSGRKVELLENPVDDLFFAIASQASAVPTVVSVGRLSRQKAPDRFAAVAKAVRQRIPSARFVWVGGGDSRYEPILRSAGCEVTGWISLQEVAAYLSNATVYLQTSRWEGLPVSVIQALAAGVPCVVHDCIGNRDAVTHESTGFVAASADDLALRVSNLLQDPSLRTRMSQNARCEARRRFGREAFGQRVRQLYSVAEQAQRREAQTQSLPIRATS